MAGKLNLRLIELVGRQPIRASHSIAEVGSKRVRSPEERAVLGKEGTDTTAIELQGELDFAEAELAVRRLVEVPGGVHLAVVDFRRVRRAEVSTAAFFAELHQDFAARGVHLVFSGLGRHSEFLDAMIHSGGSSVGHPDTQAELLTFDELDAALEWCETQLLIGATAQVGSAAVELHDHEMLHGLSAADLAAVEGLLERRQFAAGSPVLRRGDSAEELYLVTQGQLSVMSKRVDGQPSRLATLSAGMVLGELAFSTGETRASTVWADSDVVCFALSAAGLAELARSRPTAEAGILRNLVGITSRRAARMREELTRLTD